MVQRLSWVMMPAALRAARRYSLEAKHGSCDDHACIGRPAGRAACYAHLVCDPQSLNAAGSSTVVHAAKRPDNERIVVTGMGVASCFGNNVDTYYDK